MTEYLGLDEIGLVSCTERLNKTKQRVCVLQVPSTVHLWVQGAEKGQKPVKRRKRRKSLEWELVINLDTSYWGTGENLEDSLNRVQAGQTESCCTLPSIAVVLWFYTWPRLPSFQPLCSRGSFEFRGWLYYRTVPHPHKVQHPSDSRDHWGGAESQWAMGFWQIYKESVGSSWQTGVLWAWSWLSVGFFLC